MTIRNLEIFEEVCRCMNMSKAAQNLLVSQSSVSQAIASLEKEYDTILFERLNHTLEESFCFSLTRYSRRSISWKTEWETASIRKN